jgi:hypothetical protein
MENKNKTIQVEFWDCEYKGAPSKLVRTEEWEDCEESFIKYYDLNNRFKYCNGTHYSFVDKEVRERYLKFFEKHHTIENYYKGGVVD